MRSIPVIRQKKGDIFQVLFMIVLVFAVAVVGLITLVLTTNINNFWDDSGLLNDTAVGTKAINKLQDDTPKTTDYAVFLLFVGMNIGLLVGAVRTNFSPVIIILFIFLTLIAIMAAAGVVNMYQGLAQQSTVLPISQQLTLTNFLFSKYFPLVISMICAMIMIVMWGKSGGEFG